LRKLEEAQQKTGKRKKSWKVFTQTIIGKCLCPGSRVESRFSRKDTGETKEKGCNAKQVVLKQHANKGCNANQRVKDFTQTTIGEYLCPGSRVESRFSRKDTGEKGRNANQVVLKQHANKGRNANRTDINGNRTLELVRKQLEEDGRKTE
jgi:hypothetical protein